ncbi:AAC_HP2_G0026520.mRNA.1.CDS.1 [Saccharomyces cerevisiae]|uniref:Ubiquitin-binding SDF ubiquitin ligase complex subunit met30 n=1 Tax=Saccharomyces pastorianus TaxID=27292 RepID=A0A6C1DTT2_SACPS|nr:Met30p [Saccharomyces cerevisiae FostersO]QID80181.1 ubiquitin-binding SDF ubiquitin ligase complex subunit met30 [Saccharomyces pastorianus]CAI5259069.1 AAC_HP2_G0026520.mRNA.1.CDS.1 [Saccharomyces cerevisiae]CAI6460803.1 AAC_HP2_G0026520.mRNA.1.CDS.1 [Saccharomyces cerevisiae]CAI6464417.1 AAC_HP1_G0027670.mRNA.1.CDS.1 [Saccharomyces cerevisiae]
MRRERQRMMSFEDEDKDDLDNSNSNNSSEMTDTAMMPPLKRLLITGSSDDLAQGSSGKKKMTMATRSPSSSPDLATNDSGTRVQPLPEYNFTKFCYRHNPDIQFSPTHTACYKQDLKRTQEINANIAKLPLQEQSDIHHIISKYSNSNDKIRKLILDGILSTSCFPQLSYISSLVTHMIKIDFISILPQELSLKILSYLDCQSLCNATRVCRKWQKLADDDRVWYHMCEQHIDRKCPNCGWGLPLLHMKRARIQQNSTGSSSNADIQTQTTRPWKVIYRERFKVESNWRKGHCRIQEFKGHMDGVLTLQFNYRLLFTGSYDSTIGIWDLFTGKLIRRLSGHSDGVKTLYFDDRKLITGSLDKTIRVWNYITGECISTYRGHSDSVLSVDSYQKVIVSGSADKTVKVWHVESRTCYTLRGHTEWVNCVKLHPKSFSCFSCSDDTTIRMWDIRTNSCLKVFRGHVGQVQKIIPLTIKDVENLATDNTSDGSSPQDDPTMTDGADESDTPSNEQETVLDENIPYPTHLLSCGLDNTIKLWDVKTGKCIRTQFGHVEGVWDIAADNFRIISGSHDGSIKVWDLQSGKCMHTFNGRRLQRETQDTQTQSLGDKVAPIACVCIGDSECFSGDEFGCVKMYKFDLND